MADTQRAPLAPHEPSPGQASNPGPNQGDPASGCVSVVIPVRDDPAVVRTVEGVLAARAGFAGTIEVIVVDHCSQPGFEAVLARLPEGVRVLRSDAGTVYSARNEAVRLASGEVIFFTDADCEPVPGWIAEGLEHVARGADIVQGFSGSSANGRGDALIQWRYEAHYRRLRPDVSTECDTRNLAVRRSVFERVCFNGAWRRTSDTEFGLVAEREGARVEYCPAMRVQHSHNSDLRIFVAKQICHGWGAQRIMREQPGVRWHGAHLRAVAAASHTVGRWPFNAWGAPLVAWVALSGASLLERSGTVLPFRVQAALLTALDKGGALAGHLMYERGGDEPRPSALSGRAILD